VGLSVAPASSSGGSTGGGLVSLDEAKLHLDMPTSDTTVDAELQGFIDAATPLIENICGPITSESVTEWHDGGAGDRSALVLRRRPVLSVTSVTEYLGQTPQVLAAATTPANAAALSYSLEVATGTIIRRSAAGTVYPFAWGEQNVQVVYTAGFGSTPANVRLAALELIRHLWQSTQQGGRPAFNGNPADGNGFGPAGGGYAVPNFVIELLKPNERIPGIA